MIDEGRKTGRERPGGSFPNRYWWRLLRPLLLAALALALAVHSAVLHLLMSGVLVRLNFNDFGKFYYSAERWREGLMMYGPNAATLMPIAEGRAEYFWNLNPPHFHVLLLPLLHVSIETAYAIWLAANVLALLAAVMFIARTVRHRISPAAWLFSSLLFLASAPALTWSVTGQFTGFMTLAGTLVWMEMRAERWTTAAVAIGLLCSVKPFLGILWLYLLLKRKWRAAALAAAAFCMAFGIGLLVFGLAAHREWMGALKDTQWVGAVMNASVYGAIGRSWSADVFVRDAVPRALSAIAGLSLLLVGLASAAPNASRDRAVLILLVTSLLASPLGWVYYLPIIAGPLFALYAAGHLDWRWLIVLSGFLVPHFELFPFTSRVFAMTLGSVYTWSLVGVWLLSVREPPERPDAGMSGRTSSMA